MILQVESEYARDAREREKKEGREGGGRGGNTKERDGREETL